MNGLVAVAALAVAVVALIPSFRSTKLTEESNRIAQHSDLSFVKLDVTSTVELTQTTDYNGLGPPKVEPVNAAAAKIILRNSGQQTALIKELRVHISKAWALKGCHGAGPGETSVTYDFVLPGDIDRRTFPIQMSKPIDFEVAGQSDDRLAVTIGEERLGETGWSWITAASAEVVLTDDRTVRTAEFILMNSAAIDRVTDLARKDAQDPDLAHQTGRTACVQENIGMLNEALRAPGVHSPSLQTLVDRLAEVGYTEDSSPGRNMSTTVAPKSSAPAAPGQYRNVWVAQLASLPEATTSPVQVQEQIDDLSRRTGVDVQAEKSSVYGSLNAGYWALFYPGSFVDGYAALEFCSIRGISEETHCVGRYFSASDNDKHLICRFSDPDNSLNCIRR